MRTYNGWSMPEPYLAAGNGSWVINDGAFGYFYGHSRASVVTRWEEAVDTYNQATGRKPEARVQLPLLPWDLFGPGRSFPETTVLLNQWVTDMNKALEEWNG